MGGVKIGFTGSMNAVPIISTKNKGRINVEKHCLFDKCRLAAVNGGEILVGEGTSLGRNTIIVAHERISIGQNVHWHLIYVFTIMIIVLMLMEKQQDSRLERCT